MKTAGRLALGLGILASALYVLSYSKEVTFVIDGRARDVRTRARTVGGVLAGEAVSLGPGDVLTPEPEEPAGAGTTIALERARPVLIRADGSDHRIFSVERTPQALLELAGVEISPGDRVLFDGQEVDPDTDLPLLPAYGLLLARAHPVRIVDKGRIRTVHTTAATLGEALWEAGIVLHEADKASLPLDTPISGPSQVTLERASPITIHQGPSTYEAFTSAATVGEALEESGFPLQGLDYSLPNEASSIPEDGQIELVRVLEITRIDQELLPYGSEFGPDPDLLIDTRGISRPGVYGVDASRTRIRYVNGQEVWQQVEDRWTALEPQPLVMGYGTKIEVRTIDTPQGVLEYWRAAPMYATSYSPCRIFTDRCDSVTSSGATLQHGVAAVTLRHYRSLAGSRVYVPGYGIATILDVGGGIPGRSWIDLGYSDDNYVSWHEWTTVYFLTPVPPEGLILFDLN